MTLEQYQDYVNAYITANGRNAITGNVMKTLLLEIAEKLFEEFAVSADAGNQATIGTDGFVFVPLASSGITIGTTDLNSGTNGGILFQNSSNKVAQNADLHWDNANNRLSIGQGNAPGAKLDVRAPGALSSDTPLRLRNSANTADLMIITGDSSCRLPNVVGIGMNAASNRALEVTGVSSGVRATTTNANSTTISGTNNGVGGTAYAGDFTATGAGAGTRVGIRVNASGATHNHAISVTAGNIAIGTGGSGEGSPNRCIIWANTSVPPKVVLEDTFAMYSADVAAGNTAPHFKTEMGAVIKLYQQDLPTIPTTAEIATLLSNLGLANLI